MMGAVIDRLRLRRLTGALGILIGLAGLFFVVRLVTTQWHVVAKTIQDSDLLLLLLAYIFGLVGMAQIGLGWKQALSIVGGRISAGVALHGYFIGQLGKYIPGAIWPVLGRSELARRAGVSASSAYFGTLLSIGATYLAALVVALISLPSGLNMDASPIIAGVGVVAILALVAIALHPGCLSGVGRAVSSVARRRLDVEAPRWGASLLLVARHIPAWVAITLATVTISAALGVNGDFWNIVFATAIAWIAGFLMIPVPGGLGVREAMFVATATSLPTALAATVAIAARLLFVAVDASGAAFVSMRGVLESATKEGSGERS